MCVTPDGIVKLPWPLPLKKTGGISAPVSCAAQAPGARTRHRISINRAVSTRQNGICFMSFPPCGSYCLIFVCIYDYIIIDIHTVST